MNHRLTWIHKTHHYLDLRGITISLLIIYFTILHGSYINLTFLSNYESCHFQSRNFFISSSIWDIQRKTCSLWNDISKSVTSFQLQLICFLKTSIKRLKIFLEIGSQLFHLTINWPYSYFGNATPLYCNILQELFSNFKNILFGQGLVPKTLIQKFGIFQNFPFPKSSNWESWECLHSKFPHTSSSCGRVFSLFLCWPWFYFFKRQINT